MGSSLLYLFNLMLFLLLSCLHLVLITTVSSSSSSESPLCRDYESSALLQFKQSFSKYAFEGNDPKTISWNTDESSDCCSWDGVECDNTTGHVIGLHLSSNFLHGSINSSSSLFRLIHLQKLNLAHNNFNYSQIPSTIGRFSRLSYLNLSNSMFSGQIPSEISALSKLTSLDLTLNENLLSIEKSTLNSLLQNMTGLKVLRLSQVSISSEVPNNILANLSSLTSLFLEDCGLQGNFPSSLRNLTRLASLNLGNNNFTGEIPSWIGNLTQLSHLGFSDNFFHGSIPQSISRLSNLKALHLSDNNLSGKVNPEMFLSLKYLTELDPSDNNLTLLITSNNSLNATLLPKLKLLGLRSCNLDEFPDFLRHQDKLQFLDLSNNGISGQIPKWFWNISKETLSVILLDDNSLTGFVEPLQWTSLRVLFLGSNMLQGSLPVPPASTFVYEIGDNAMTGEISPLFCNLSSLKALDLSHNSLSGTIPQCLGDFTSSLSVLFLADNKFHGTIPQTYSNGNKLKAIDLSQNQLQGLVPRSLANCIKLEFLDLGNNHINDTFPYWLGTLPELKVLLLKSNRFHSAIQGPKTNFEFPKLRIIDLSYNGFTGMLPSDYFQCWNAMKIVNVSRQTNDGFGFTLVYSLSGFGNTLGVSCTYSITITNKGMQRFYEKIPEIFRAIDLSNNKFEGGVPESIGNLQGLQLLNLSNNILSGQVPSCLGNLTEIEALDLSQNKFSGDIPDQLVELNFLAVFNVSYNHLTGPIPHGKQFDTFDNTSFQGNLGLCGSPLSKKCGTFDATPPPPDEGEDSKFPSGNDWIFIVAGYGSGLIVGLVIGGVLTTWKHEWFIETFGQKKQRERLRRRRN